MAARLCQAALLRKLVLDKLSSKECVRNGWVLEGYPPVAAEAHAMVTAGMMPTTVICVEIDDAEATRRLVGRRIDESESQARDASEIRARYTRCICEIHARCARGA
eukprot:104996-Pleurochrysis_carterae.AAC.2